MALRYLQSLLLFSLRWLGRTLAVLGMLALSGGVLLAAGAVWYLSPPATPVAFPLEEGVVYERRLLTQPRRNVLHLIALAPAVLNSQAPGGDASKNAIAQWVVSLPHSANGLPFTARTPSEFVAAEKLLVAVNGDYFSPYRAHWPWDYYPHSGDGVVVEGPSVCKGQRYEPAQRGYFARQECCFSLDGKGGVHFGPIPADAVLGIAGGPLLVKESKRTEFPDSEATPQTAIAYRAETRQLFLVVVDGRQPGYSHGLTNRELADLLVEMGMTEALRLDGGGSAALAGRLPDGTVTVLSRPIQCGIPGWERPVGNNIGLCLQTR